MDIRLFKCNKCGKIVVIMHESRCNMLRCCAEPMEEILPNTQDASQEKHVPVYTINGNICEVCVGSVLHPSMEEHYIDSVILQTNMGNQRKILGPGKEPKCSFALLPREEVTAVYAYCNLHGLWKA